MADHILSKSLGVLQGTTALTWGEVVYKSGDQQVSRATSAQQEGLLGVALESVDAAKVTEGKVVPGVAILGIARVVAGSAVTGTHIAAGDKVTNDTAAKVVKATAVAGGAVPKLVLGIAVQSATASGDQFDVLLTPGQRF
jgi:hypothetical protein